MFSHPPILEKARTEWTDEQATAAFAQRLARSPAIRNAYVSLQGDLGTGKTTLARHLLRAVGVQGRIKSPSYAVVETYTGQADLPIWHFDFYRFEDPLEWEDAGFRELFAAPGLKLAEWPEHVGDLLPPADLALHISMGMDAARSVQLTASTAAGAQLLRFLAT